MAETRVQSALSPTIWDDKFSTEFFQDNPFSAYAGTGSDNLIVMKEEFASKRGNGITYEFITSLDRGSIKGYQPLRGHEDKLGEFGDKIHWEMRKKGVSLHELDVDLAAIDLRKAAKTSLRNWADEDVKFAVIAKLAGRRRAARSAYSSARRRRTSTPGRPTTPTESSTRAVGPTIRVRRACDFARQHHVAGGRLTRSAVSILKRMALTARPRITPVRVSKSDNRRMYVAFRPPLCDAGHRRRT
jgi:hypothetical protein